MSEKLKIVIAVYTGSLPDQVTAWVGANDAIREIYEKFPNFGDLYDIVYEEYNSDNIYRNKPILKSRTDKGPPASVSNVTEEEFAKKFGESDIHIFIDHPHQGCQQLENILKLI